MPTLKIHIMLKRFVWIAASLWMSLASFVTHAQTPQKTDRIEFYFIYLPGLLEADGKTGPLAEVIHEVARRADIEFIMRDLPLRRQDRELYGDKIVAAGPELDPLPEQILARGLKVSLPIAYRKDFAFVRKGTPIPKTIQDVQTLRLVTSPATSLPPPVIDMPNIIVLKAPSDAAAASILSSGRVDVWINDETTTLTAIKQANITNIVYDAERPLYEWPTRILLSRATPSSLVERINTAIISMVDDGTMLRLLPKNYSKNPDLTPPSLPGEKEN